MLTTLRKLGYVVKKVGGILARVVLGIFVVSIVLSIVVGALEVFLKFARRFAFMHNLFLFVMVTILVFCIVMMAYLTGSVILDKDK